MKFIKFPVKENNSNMIILGRIGGGKNFNMKDVAQSWIEKQEFIPKTEITKQK